jgi:serine/threonine protein phosphatase PrpC
MLAQGLAPSQAACELLDACLANDPKEARGVGCDNMTAVVVLLQPQGGQQQAGQQQQAQQQQPQQAQ